jgi:NifU-like protein involved in Fe-S cluster formation/bacterioferritin-associated ferredoxin
MNSNNNNQPWAYSQTVREHFFKPQNLLESDEEGATAAGVGQVGSLACGDIMKMWIWVENDQITKCKWRTFGCASAIASTSMLSVMVSEKNGMPLEKALKIKPADIVKKLEGLPDRKIHCSVLGDQALRKAIFNYYKKSGQVEKIPNDPIMCSCVNVRKSDIEEAFYDGAEDFEAIQEKTQVATVCGKCTEKVKDFVQELKSTCH